MLKIWEMKRAADADKAANRQRVSAAQLRVQGDISGLELPPEMQLDFPDANNLMHFTLAYTPATGMYAGGKFVFDFSIPPAYPIEPPKVRLKARIWHPNIDLDGMLCLNILREDWKPVLALNHVAMGIQFLFLEPNKNDPLNRAAAESFQRDAGVFAREVRETMAGHSLNGVEFDDVLHQR